MSALTATTLFSGSSGNATYIRGRDTEILVDAGVSASAICRALNDVGSDISRIGAILVTHEHIDHVKGLEILSKKYQIPIHMTALSHAHLKEHTYLDRCVTLHDSPRFDLELGGMGIHAFPVPHDSYCCVGYRIAQDESTLAIATDIGHVTREILDCFLGAQGVILESNHDIDLLIQNPHYPPMLKERILSGGGHLSNLLCAKFLNYLAQSGTRRAILAHLSKENNTPELALEAIRGMVCEGLDVAVAEEKGFVTIEV